MTINAGELRERLVLQNPPAVADGSGGQTGDWTTVKTIRAKVEALRGGEAAQAAIATTTVQFRVTIRRRPIDTGQRLRWASGGQVMDIRAVLPSIDHAWTVLLCEGRAA
jgi:SPP1 family predicted phage head-tail adaptor